MKKNKVITLALILTALIISLCVGIVVEKSKVLEIIPQKITKFSQLKGKDVGITTGSTFEKLIKKYIPNAIPQYFNSYPDQIEALKTDKIVAFMADEPVARNIINLNPGFRTLKKNILNDSYGIVFAKGNTKLKSEFDRCIVEFEKDGTMKNLDSLWFSKDESKKTINNISVKGPQGVIQLATNSTVEPFVYYKNNKIVGFEIDLINRICKKLGYGLEITDMDFSAIIPAVTAGKADIAASCISITPERAKSVLFSLPTYRGGTVIVVDDNFFVRNETAGFWNTFKKSFYRTFVLEKRYKLVLQGLMTTLVISFFSVLFGSVFAGLICWLRLSKNKFLTMVGRSYIGFFQGTPILVFLMMVYYIVFQKVDIDPVIAAIIAFSLNYAAYAAEIYRTGIEAVDKGQIEAATAMGFNKVQTFVKIITPQALRHSIPTLRSEIMSTIRMTSIVGYIGIQDLTKVSDIIRSRTYETFFPLIATALIYFILTFSLVHFLSRIEIKINPKSRKRELKGVVLAK